MRPRANRNKSPGSRAGPGRQPAIPAPRDCGPRNGKQGPPTRRVERPPDQPSIIGCRNNLPTFAKEHVANPIIGDAAQDERLGGILQVPHVDTATAGAKGEPFPVTAERSGSGDVVESEPRPERCALPQFADPHSKDTACCPGIALPTTRHLRPRRLDWPGISLPPPVDCPRPRCADSYDSQSHAFAGSGCRC